MLDDLVLAYQPLWNREREVAGHLLVVQPRAAVAGLHGGVLLDCLCRDWPRQAPPLFLLARSAALLIEVLEHAAATGPWIAVPETLLDDRDVLAQLQAAHARGVRLAWHGERSEQLDSALAACFTQGIVTLSAGDALRALRAALPPPTASPGASGPLPFDSPVHPDLIYASVPSRVLVDHCLDDRRVQAVAGWPAEDVLHAYAHRPVPPGRKVIGELLAAVEADLALERIARLLGGDPLLAWRFLCHANSAAVGLRAGADSLRHGLMLLGLSGFQRWLREQQAQASGDIDLRPVRSAMVMRARLMELLLDPGEEEELRSEVQLCGLLSQIDLLAREPLAAALQRFPVSARISASLLGDGGPYAPFLAVARALEYPASADVPALCDQYGLDLGRVNQALLRMMAEGSR